MDIKLPNYTNAKVLVVGDLILDRYWSGSAQRISPEAPVPVVLVDGFEERPGGAGNVARSITALGANCSLAALLGDDGEADQLEELLVQATMLCVKDPTAKTVAKLRVLSRNQQLIRLDFEGEFTQVSVKDLTTQVSDEIERHDVVIFSDYRKGALTNISQLIVKANSAGVKTFVDPKGTDCNYSESVRILGCSWRGKY